MIAASFILALVCAPAMAQDDFASETIDEAYGASSTRSTPSKKTPSC